MRHKYLFIIYSILFIGSLISCTEAFEIEDNGFESYLVVEGKITNQLKFQEILLSNTLPLTANNAVEIENYSVNVTDNLGNTFNFQEIENGIYRSVTEFNAFPEVSYQLNITSNSGISYQSNAMILPDLSELDQIYAEEVNNEYIQILANGRSTENGKYFRYEYEETYKVIAPFHSNMDATVENLTYDFLGTPEFDIVISPREQEEQICYVSENSKEIILGQTENLSSNIVSRVPIRKIAFDNSIIKTRYSILVKQYSESLEAYTFYKILKDLGNIDNVLSQSQPGSIQGNIASTNSTKNVIGFFDVVTEQEQRIFFNYSDFSGDEPAYSFECDYLILDYEDTSSGPPPTGDGDSNERAILLDRLMNKNYKYVGGNYEIVNPECGDCTTFGSNIIPDFWTE